ncbi:MAG TPA: hypothetical protein VF192_08850 [Longimicrobiales bacterium]
MRTLAAAVPALALLLLALVAAPAAAQRVERRGVGAPSIDERLDALLSGPYELVTRDTTLGAGETSGGSVLVLGATLTVEGVVAGDLVAVQGNVFLRPTARVLGDVVNVGGGLYRSEAATIQGILIDRPEAPYRVVREGDVLYIEPAPVRQAFDLDGLGGWHAPQYDRVNGLSVGWGATYLPSWLPGFEPRLHGEVIYRSERGAWDGGADFSLGREGTTLTLGARQATLTNEGWIRDPVRNSLSYLFAGRDYRDYYGARQLFVELRRRSRGALTWDARLRAQIEDAEPLRADDPWALILDSVRPNLPADEGRIASLLAVGAGEWAGEFSAGEAGLELELAGAAAGGDFSFGRFHAWTEWAIAALANHGLEIRAHFRGPLPGTDALPRQRWSFVGGSGTLPAAGIAAFRGDRLVFVETTYIIPLGPRFAVPVLGEPDLELIHAAGKAWPEGGRSELEQNVGVRLRLSVLSARLVTDPGDALDEVEFDLGLSLPRTRRRPWEPRRRAARPEGGPGRGGRLRRSGFDTRGGTR